MSTLLPDIAHKGRGAISNRVGRYGAYAREAADDGWLIAQEELAPVRTTVSADRSRSIIAHNTSPDVPFDRSILEVLDAYNHPVVIVTKSVLVVRDIDILGSMAARGLAQVSVSVTKLDREIARTLEPRAPTQMRRIETLQKLSAEGIPTGVMAAPMIPGLTDSELEQILAVGRESGAGFASYILLRLPLELLRLPLEIGDLFAEWLNTHHDHPHSPDIQPDETVARRQDLRCQVRPAQSGHRAVCGPATKAVRASMWAHRLRQHGCLIFR